MKFLSFTIVFLIMLFLSCGTTVLNSTDSNGTVEIIAAPQYPVILVHGIVAHDRPAIINYWGRIPETLEKNGVKVFFGNTDSWGDYESNAIILKSTIDNVLDETNSEKVNIIAHSKGGLDSRYLIWKYNYGNKVASLTTVSTPHHGSEISDLIYQQNGLHLSIVRKTLMQFGKFFGDINPNPYSVNYLLRTDSMKEFNEVTGMDPNVYYQSMYTTMNNPIDDLMFYYSYPYIKSVHGDNDGIVSEWSAKWGNNVIKIGTGISHAEIADYKMRTIAGIHIPDIYVKMVNRLSQMGF